MKPSMPHCSMCDEYGHYPSQHQPPDIDHLIRARYIELGFSDEFIKEIEAFTRAEAERLKKLRLIDGQADG